MDFFSLNLAHLEGFRSKKPEQHKVTTGWQGTVGWAVVVQRSINQSISMIRPCFDRELQVTNQLLGGHRWQCGLAVQGTNLKQLPGRTVITPHGPTNSTSHKRAKILSSPQTSGGSIVFSDKSFNEYSSLCIDHIENVTLSVFDIRVSASSGSC